jgi:transposase
MRSLRGRRDPLTLARLCHKRVKSSESTVAKSLEGDYRPEHIFALRQSPAAYRYSQQLVLETDQEIQRRMVELQAADNVLAKMPKRTKRLPYQRQGHEPRVFDLRSEFYRIFGVDLTNVPGISAMTSQTILCEVGTDVSRFRNASELLQTSLGQIGSRLLAVCTAVRRPQSDTDVQQNRRGSG